MRKLVLMLLAVATLTLSSCGGRSAQAPVEPSLDSLTVVEAPADSAAVDTVAVDAVVNE